MESLKNIEQEFDMMVWLCEWGIWIGLVGIVIFSIFCLIAGLVCNNDFTLVITIVGIILSLLLTLSGIIAVILDKNVPTNDYKENAIVVETYTTSRQILSSKMLTRRTQYHVILESPELEEEHEFLVEADSFDKIENGAKVLLITKEYTTKYTKKQKFDYDWEFGEIK